MNRLDVITDEETPLEAVLAEIRTVERRAGELRDRRRKIVRELLAAGYSAAEIGRAVDVSGERVRQWAGPNEEPQT